ncbi:MAG: helix-turn-helix domain-containing protein [Pseudomonadota bacterium]
MQRRETLSTDGVLAGRRVAFWNDAACQILTAQCAQPRNPHDFSGRMTCGDLGELRFVQIESDAIAIDRTPSHVAASRDAWVLVRMQLAGESLSRQDGREVLLLPGDFTLCDSVRPYQVEFGDVASMLVLRVSRATLQRYIGSPEILVHLRMSGSAGPGVLASRMLREVWHAADTLLPEVAPRISNLLLELIASSYIDMPAARLDQTCLASALRMRILSHIEQHLGDPDLTPAVIAQAFRITARHLHRVFLQQGDTVAHYILRRRLERTRAALANPLLVGRSLTRICGEQGFKGLAHFSRVFRAAYGMSPSEYREAARAGKIVPLGQNAVPSGANN